MDNKQAIEKELKSYQRKLKRYEQLKTEEPNNIYHDWDEEIKPLEEAVAILKSELCDELLKENDNLKKRISELEFAIKGLEVVKNNTRDTNVEFADKLVKSREENDNLKAEIERLKENSVQLPCKVGDIVYNLGYECSKGMKYNCELDGYMQGSLCRKCDIYPCDLHRCVEENVIEEIIVYNSYGAIDIKLEGKHKKLNVWDIFRTREEAEKALKEREVE